VNLEGIFAALTTPFAADGSVALDRLGDNINRYNRTRLSGYVVIGSTGESVMLSFGEIERIWGAARDTAASGKTLIAGTGVETTAETIMRTRRAADLGYDAALVKTPHYYKPLMTAAALEEHYRAVADASPVPVLVYSIPQYTGISVAVDWIVRLAEHPNIIGIKESSGNVQLVAEIVRSCRREFRALVGSAATLFPALLLGASGGVLALACCLPEITVEIYERTRAGDIAGASNLQGRILGASRIIAGELGPVGVKYAMDCAGYYGGDARRPLLPLTAAQKSSIEVALADVMAAEAARAGGAPE
jgi:4-hydroxy-tetrahydrodipicolinate synthase